MALLSLAIRRAGTQLRACQASSNCKLLSTLANRAWAAPPNLVANQRRDVAYGAAAATDEYYDDDESVIPGNPVRAYDSINGHSKKNLVNGHANGHAANGHVVEEKTQEERSYESDLVVVLDMDECLIHSKFMGQNNHAAQWAYQVARRRHEEGSLFGGCQQHPLGRVDSFRISLPDGDLVHVNKRPFLEEFLQQVTDKFETHVFTAAMEVYASPVLDTLDPYNTRFAKRWYRESCTFSERVGAYVKDLSKLPFEKSHRTVLVDNNPLSFLANPSNGILVSNFYDDPSDDTLKAVVDLLHELDEMEDVRPELEKRFGLKEALQDAAKNGVQ